MYLRYGKARHADWCHAGRCERTETLSASSPVPGPRPPVGYLSCATRCGTGYLTGLKLPLQNLPLVLSSSHPDRMRLAVPACKSPVEVPQKVPVPNTTSSSSSPVLLQYSVLA